MNFPQLFASPSPVFPSRRSFLRRAGGGFGLLALAGLLEQQGLLADEPAAERRFNPLAPRKPHFAAKAKSVIWLFMNGGPSQVDTWDYKPELAKRDGQELKGFDKNTGFFTDQVGPLMKSPFAWQQHGQSGTWVPEIFPEMAEHVDDMAFIHSCWTETNNHSPALFQINTGMTPHGFPLRRLLGHLRPGHRKPEPAGLRRHVRHARPRSAQGPRPELGGRLPARHLPGHRAQSAGHSHRQPGRVRRSSATPSSAASST